MIDFTKSSENVLSCLYYVIMLLKGTVAECCHKDCYKPFCKCPCLIVEECSISASTISTMINT